MQEGAETKMIVGVPSQAGVIYPITIVCAKSKSKQSIMGSLRNDDRNCYDNAKKKDLIS